MNEQLKQFKMLLRVKDLKKEQAFKAMQLKREEVRHAETQLEKATEEVEKSKSTLGAREDAIYHAVMGKIMGLDNLDQEVKARVVSLHKSHEKLEDNKERAKHVHLRLSDELEKARSHYQTTLKNVDKYDILTGDLKKSVQAAQEQREEGEIEDTFRVRKAIPS